MPPHLGYGRYSDPPNMVCVHPACMPARSVRLIWTRVHTYMHGLLLSQNLIVEMEVARIGEDTSLLGKLAKWFT